METNTTTRLMVCTEVSAADASSADGTRLGHRIGWNKGCVCRRARRLTSACGRAQAAGVEMRGRERSDGTGGVTARYAGMSSLSALTEGDGGMCASDSIADGEQVELKPNCTRSSQKARDVQQRTPVAAPVAGLPALSPVPPAALPAAASVGVAVPVAAGRPPVAALRDGLRPPAACREHQHL